MNLKQRLEKLEIQIQPENLEIIVVGARFFRDLQQKKEISMNDLKELSEKHPKITISGMLDDDGAELLANIDCDNIEFGSLKRYIGINFSAWSE